MLLAAGSALPAVADAGRELRVCAESDNLPFSNSRLEGFENKIARVLGEDLHASLQYVWSQQTGESIGAALSAGKCDMIIGAPADWGAVLTTKPYYASTYVFVYSKKKYARLSSFDDPVLRKLKIGLPVISGGGANPPPTYALARRGLSSNVIGFSMFQPNKIIEAVSAGDIDVAVLWGPFGGYFATRQSASLAVTPVSTGDNDASLRFNYDISVGVRKEDSALRDQLEGVLGRRHKQILKILDAYGVPVISPTGGRPMSARSIQ
jgi:quinoprotein dehydrogenase-associated probable ABC transporter substrate-binding protein